MIGILGNKRVCGASILFVALVFSAARGGEFEKYPEARIGLAALDVTSGKRTGNRADERFPMCSTFKLLAVAAVLRRVDRSEERLDRFVRYTQADILEHAPITKQHLADGGMTVEALCAAAITYSDNTAGNLLLKTLGGPAGLTNYARSLEDEVTRLDRLEPELNNTAPGEVRDTTSPRAMLRDIQRLLVGDVLSVTSRSKLESWLMQNTTGEAMIRAGVPKDWKVGDKTGRNNQGNSNDLAIIRKSNGEVILLCIFVEAPKETTARRDEMMAHVATEVVRGM